jgi:RimJ/RimL family protein N-acetyltransferase
VSSCIPERLVTARLIGERLQLDHGPELATLLGDPRVARTLFPNRQPPDRAEVVAGIESHVKRWEQDGFGSWLLRDRVTSAMVGRGGLQYTGVTGRQEVEVGWVIAPERWGQGLATEIALASVDVGFEALRLSELIAYTLHDNLASRRVMEKAAFAFDRELEHAGMPHVVYRRRAIRARAWSS